MQHRFRWAVAFLSLAVCILGAVSSRMFAQPVWDVTGLRRLLIYTASSGAAATLFFFGRRRLMVPCSLAAAAIYTAVLAGPAPVCALALFLLASYGIGMVLFRTLGIGDGSGELAIVAGTAVWGFFAGLLAHTEWNTAPVFTVLLGVPAIAGGWLLFHAWKRPARAFPLFDERADYWAGALLLFILGAQFLMALKPEVSADGVSVHLAVPLHMAYHHGWHFDVTEHSLALMPMGVDWCFATLVSLGGEFAAKLLPFAFLVINSLLIERLCRFPAPRHLALLMAAAYAATPAVQLTTGSLFTDNPWVAFLLGAAFTLIEATRRRETQALPLAGLLLGAALAAKVGALAFALPSLVWIFAVCAFRTQQRWPAKLGSSLAAVVVLAVVAAPPYLTAWVKTGNPVFPFLNAVFRSPYFDSTNFENVHYRTPLSWHVPFDLTFHTGRFLEGQDGALGLIYLLAFLLLFSAPRRIFTRGTVAALALAAVHFVISFRGTPYVRYLIPSLPLLLFAFVQYLDGIRAGQRILYRTILSFAVAAVIGGVYLLPASGYWHRNFCLNPMNFRAEAAAYVAFHAPSRVLVDQLNRTAPGEPAAFFASGIAGLNARPYIAGWHDFTFYRECRAAQSAAEIRTLMVRRGIRHFVTPLPDCGQPPLPQLSGFLAQYTRERFRAGCLYTADLAADDAPPGAATTPPGAGIPSPRP